jgi:TusE/DsrC/DsvC family sulfur relay protein
MLKTYVGQVVEVSDEGYLTDFSQWNREVAESIANEEGIELGEQHWAVIDYIQQSFQNGDPLSIRSFGKRGPVSIKEFYALFPEGPLKKASRIAGIPKPVSCV